MKSEHRIYRLPFYVDVKITHKDGGIFPKKEDKYEFNASHEDIVKVQSFLEQNQKDFNRIIKFDPTKPEYTWPANIELYSHQDTTIIVSWNIIEVEGVTHEEVKRLEVRKKINLEKLKSEISPSLLESTMGEIFGKGICHRCFRDCKDSIQKDIRVERSMGSLQKISYYYCPDCEEILDRVTIMDNLTFG